MSIGLRCRGCTKELIPIIAHNGLNELNNSDVYTLTWVCPNYRWYKPWHDQYPVTHFNDLFMQERPLRFTAKQLYERYGIIVGGKPIAY